MSPAMSSAYANVSVPSARVSVLAASWLAQMAQTAQHALDVLASARPSQSLEALATRCEGLQPGLARELRAAAARVSEG